MADTFPFAKYFGEINLLSSLQVPDTDKTFFDRPPRDPEQKELLLYLGCNVLRTAHLAQTAIAVLRAMGFDFNAVGGAAYCCGIIHHRNGQAAASRAYSASSMRHVMTYGATKVIMWCPSCNEHFDDVISHEQDVPFPYEHFTAFVARHLDRARFVRRIDKRVSLHYHTGHPQQDSDWACTRTILQAIPGIQYVHLPSTPAFGRHCSPNYIGRLGRPAWQAEIETVARASSAAGVDVLGTIYHSCHREICENEARHPFEVVNYITLMAEAMGLETPPDWYKTQKLRGDPEATFEEIRPTIESQGLDPERVKEVLAKSFSPACETGLPNPS
jgi:heterodisulfide reductase subunit D